MSIGPKRGKPTPCVVRGCERGKWKRVEGLTFALRCSRCSRTLATCTADTQKLADEIEQADWNR